MEWGGVGDLAAACPEGRHWLCMALHTPGASESGLWALPEEAWGGGGARQGQPRVASCQGGPFDQQADLSLLVDVLPRDRLPNLYPQLPLGICRWMQMAPAYPTASARSCCPARLP